MAIEQLVAFIPPPTDPVDNEGDWTIAEAEFGITFPTDFKELIHRYGTGRFYGDLHISNPLQASGRRGIHDDLDRYRELRDATEMPLILYPANPGLLPWGGDSNGHLYCWWTDGASDDWGIVQLFHGYEDDAMEVVHQPITDFLVRFLRNEYTNMLGGQPFTEEDYHFEKDVPWVNGS